MIIQKNNKNNTTIIQQQPYNMITKQCNCNNTTVNSTTTVQYD